MTQVLPMGHPTKVDYPIIALVPSCVTQGSTTSLNTALTG
jgi:hypothetical protein